jgi:hypothetical protein
MTDSSWFVLDDSLDQALSIVFFSNAVLVPPTNDLPGNTNLQFHTGKRTVTNHATAMCIVFCGFCIKRV